MSKDRYPRSNSFLLGEPATKEEKDSEIVVKAPDKSALSRHNSKSETKFSKLKLLTRMFPLQLYEGFFKRILGYFRTVNRKAGKTIPGWFMKFETIEHVDSVLKVFKWIILPASISYVLVSLCFIKEIALDSALIGVAFFFYSNFLPDIPTIFRSKYHEGLEALNNRMPLYKNCILLLFAPLFIVSFYFGKKIGWKTIETFHNLKSLAIYTGFLLIVGFLIYASLPLGAWDLIESGSLPLYGLAGYLTHLKVDLCV